MMVYSRPVSLQDLYYASVGSRAHHPNQVISQCVVEGVGSIVAERLQTVVEELAVSVPSCRLLMRGALGFRHWLAAGPLPRTVTVQREWNGHYDETLEFLNRPLDLFRGPVAEIIQIISEQRTYLIFRVHHAVMDGVGMMKYIQNFFAILRGEPVPRFDSRLVFENIPEGGGPTLIKPIRHAVTPLAATNNSPHPLGHCIWQRISLCSNDMLLLSRVVVALAKIAREHEAGSVRINFPIDLRRQNPTEENASANLVGTIVLDVDEGETLKSLTKKFNRQLGRGKYLAGAKRLSRVVRWLPLLLLQKIVFLTSQRNSKRKQFAFSGTVSTVGYVKLAELSALEFKAISYFGIPILPKLSPLFVVVTSHEQGSEIVLGTANTQGIDDQLAQLATRLKDKIENSSI